MVYLLTSMLLLWNSKADAKGVIASINTGMVKFGLENWKSQTVAFGRDGASVYMLEGLTAFLLRYMWKFPGSLVCIA